MAPGNVRSLLRVASLISFSALCWCAGEVFADGANSDGDTTAPTKNDYPTVARVEYVQECISRNGGNLADLYKCSCVIDRFAVAMTYDEFVEAATFSRYSTLPGEGGGIFRDPDRAKERVRTFRKLEGDAYHACGLKSPT